MKTFPINNSYVRISAIESVNIIPKRGEGDNAIVSIDTCQMHYNKSFSTDAEAEAYAKIIVDLMDD